MSDASISLSWLDCSAVGDGGASSRQAASNPIIKAIKIRTPTHYQLAKA